MANEIRVRANLISGTLSVALSNVDTTMSAAALANLPVIDTTNYAAITIENEIVWVTAHTAAATTATILRAQEGTSAAAHSINVAWQHGPTAFDGGTDWTPYTPTLTGITLGNGTVTAKYAKVGRIVFFDIKLVWGTTTTYTAAPIGFSLPTTMSADYGTEASLGQATFLHTGASNWPAYAMRMNATTIECQGVLSSGTNPATFYNPTNTVPFTWASTDVVSVHGFYQSTT